MLTGAKKKGMIPPLHSAVYTSCNGPLSLWNAHHSTP